MNKKAKTNSSIEDWYTYLRQEEHLEPEEAERQAYLNHRSGCLIPEVTYPQHEKITELLPDDLF